MIKLIEHYKVSDTSTPFRLEIGECPVTSEKQFAQWVVERGTTRLTRADVILFCNLLPSLIYDYIVETGCSVRFDQYGIIRPKVSEGKVRMYFYNSPKLLKRLNSETFNFEHCMHNGPECYIQGGHRGSNVKK